jgi:hypothetical protein
MAGEKEIKMLSGQHTFPSGKGRNTSMKALKSRFVCWLFVLLALSSALVSTSCGGGAAPQQQQEVSVTISPTSANVTVNGTQQFTATVTGTNNTSVTWSVNNVTGGNSTVGTISASGLYTAPAAVPSPPTVTVTATSVADPTKSASASVTILPPPVSVTISPTSANVDVNGMQQFTATVTGSSNTNVTWSVNGVQGGNTTVGTVSTSGLYTAPATVPSPPTVTVTATSVADPTKSASANVTILSGVSVTISPTSANVDVNGTQQFTATVTGSSNTNVTWSVNGVQGGNTTVGTVSTSGLYTAPATVPSPPTVTVTVTSVADPTQSAIAMVTIESQGQVVPAQYFGLDISDEVLNPNGSLPWPPNVGVGFGNLRLWDSGTNWALLNPNDGEYDWGELDDWLATAYTQGITDVRYTFGVVPTWASSKPDDQDCPYKFLDQPGNCDPPKHLNKDGTGTDSIWQGFVTAIVEHVTDPTYLQTHTHITHWEMINEPNLGKWTDAQLVRVAEDAYKIIKKTDPTALVSTPPFAGGLGAKKPWDTLDTYLGTCIPDGSCGWQFAENVTYHGYVANGVFGKTNDAPELVQQFITGMTQIESKYGLSVPLSDTEGSWLDNTDLPDANDQAAFAARYYLVQWPSVAQVTWYQWGGDTVGTLYQDGQTNKAGTAYGQVYDWMEGAQMSACSASGNIYTCSLTRSGGYQALAVWDASKFPCKGDSTCSTSNYTPDSQYVQYRDLDGNVTPISPPGSTIQIGEEPILLENQNP